MVSTRSAAVAFIAVLACSITSGHARIPTNPSVIIEDFAASKEASTSSVSSAHLEALQALRELHSQGFLSQTEYDERRHALVDEVTNSKMSAAINPNLMVEGRKKLPYNSTVNFLLSQLKGGLPRSYNDVLPSGNDFWTTPAYLDVGAFAPGVGRVPLDSIIAIQERTLTRYGLNLYDGAVWEIALALAGLVEVAEIYERGVLMCATTGANPVVGGLVSIRANTKDFKYGKDQVSGDSLPKVAVPGNNTYIPAMANGSPSPTPVKKIQGSYFYRMIGPDYKMQDPLSGTYSPSWKTPWPNNDTTTPWNDFGEVHFNDWKPITGENVWAAITGPLQTMWVKNCSGIYKHKKGPTDVDLDADSTPNNTDCLRDFKTFDEAPAPVQLALSIMPALKALQSPLGSMYHCPKGTLMFPADPDEETNVSNENNVSAYAAFKMLQQILFAKTAGTTDAVLLQAKTDINELVTNIEKWFKEYLMPDSGSATEPRVVYQGGHVSFDGKYEPLKINDTGGFAVDCQTWGGAVLGQKFLDANYGEGAAYHMWQETKARAAYYDPSGKLGGVGYTTDTNSKNSTEPPIWSAEWSFGAILMTRKLAYEYKKSGNAKYAADLQADADSMWELVRQPVVLCENTDDWCGGGLHQKDGGYMYANSRFFIPWGWYANPVSALCSTAWEVMLVNNFNPFKLGGGFESALPDPTEEQIAEHDKMYETVFAAQR